jgi:hypothetical protein
MSEQAQDKDQPELVELTDLGTFMGLVTAWHEANVEMLKKMEKIPGGGGLTVEFEGESIELAGDMHKGFRMGITTALGMFGQLPFTVIPDDPDENANGETH